MNYIKKLISYEIVDVIEAAINEMDLIGTDYEGVIFTYVHGLPIDTRNEHHNGGELLPVIFLFEPLKFETNTNESETAYKSGEVKLYFMDKGTKYEKLKQTQVNYANVISKMGVVVNRFLDSLENQKQVSEVLKNYETNWPDFAVSVNQMAGANASQSIMYQNLTGKEIALDIRTHKIYNC